ncbi:MAG: hypothetical protein INR66_23440 [Gordonia polyisoprenivorans]|nr:hypothetical protein [Gordonia polyisoprenivorans]
MPYATVSDVAIYAPDLTSDLDDTVETLLEQAEAEILLTFPDLDARVADGRTKLVLIKRVEAEMVSSVMRNPRAWSSTSESVGPLSNSYTINTQVASGLMKLTDVHVRLIQGVPTVAPGAAGGAYVVSLSGIDL